jgi:integrase
MARKITSRIDNRTNRLKLEVRQKPYDFTNAGEPGIAVGYRRTKDGGNWVLRKADASIRYAGNKTGAWTKNIGTADDYAEADGTHVLTFHQACEKARQMGRVTSIGAPATFSEALDAFADNLKARGGNPGNASVVRLHLKDHPGLLNKQVSLLTAKELEHWRNGLLKKGIKTATVLRISKSAKAALNLAARHDARIENRNAWRDGLGGLKDDSEPVNQVLSDADVITLVNAAYQLRPDFGLFVDTLAVTGTRTSQACRLTVIDLQAENGDPRLLMPSSRKGKRKTITRKPVPITPALAAKLKQAANGRAGHEPLLTHADGTPWDPEAAELWKLFGEIAKSTGIQTPGTDEPVTAYALRHSSITRQLLDRVPVTVVADVHDTSVMMIEKTYSAHILHHADTLIRRSLLDTSQPNQGNVVNLRG